MKNNTQTQHIQIYIVTPVLNAADTIDDTIFSIITQTGKLDIHYHIQDGGSTDGTIEKLQTWQQQLEKHAPLLPGHVRFTWNSQKDHGMYHAIMTAFAHLRIPPSAFMGWLNADDRLFPDALSTIASIGEQYPHVDWISGWECNFDAQGRLVNIERTRRYPRQIVAHGLADGIHWPFIQQESTFWRKKLWDTAGGLDSTFKLAGDWDLWRRFAQKAPLYHVEKQLGSFWRRPGQKSADMGAYRKEMDIVCSTEERRKAFATLLRARDGALSAIPSLRQDDQGVWREYRRTPSWKRRWELFGYSVLPIPAVRNAILGRLHN